MHMGQLYIFGCILLFPLGRRCEMDCLEHVGYLVHGDATDSPITIRREVQYALTF